MLTLKNDQRQATLGHKAVIEKGMNDILKMRLNVVMYATRQVLLQAQKDKKAKYEETDQTIKRQKAIRTKDYKSVSFM